VLRVGAICWASYVADYCSAVFIVLLVIAVWCSSAVQGERLRELPVPGDGEGERQRRQLHDPQLHWVTSMWHCHRLLLLYPIRPRISNTVFEVLDLIKSSFWNAE
jgi:hypothetical protein